MSWKLVSAAALLMIATPCAAVAANRLVDQWKMNEPSGSGTLRGVNGHNGKYFNIVSYASPCFKSPCFGFNGVNSWARVSDFSDLDHSNASKEYGIIVHWNRTGAAQPGSADRLVVRGDAHTGIGWELEQRTGSDAQVRICFSVTGSAAGVLGLCSQPVASGSFRNIQAWIVPSVPSVQLWLDGRLVASAVKSIGTVNMNLPLTICRSYGSNTGWCNGFMDEIKILKEF